MTFCQRRDGTRRAGDEADLGILERQDAGKSNAWRKGNQSGAGLTDYISKVQKVGKGLGWPFQGKDSPSKTKIALPRQSYDYTGRGSTYTSLLQGLTTLPLFGTFADDYYSTHWKA